MDKLSEARRYLDNAKTFLRENAGKQGDDYTDRKYVKLAGHAAYNGVLEALDQLIGKKAKGRKSVEWYIDNIRIIDKKLLQDFNVAYDVLHLAMGYDGNLSVPVSKDGLQRAERIINWVGTRLGEA